MLLVCYVQYVLLGPLIAVHFYSRRHFFFLFYLHITLAQVSAKLLNAHLYLYVSQHLSGAASQTGCPEADRESDCQYEQL